MFDSLKKKFSRTGEKLEEELKEEVSEENNIQEEFGRKSSFFSFGKKKEEKIEENSNLIPESEELVGDVEEEITVNEEKKSRFWNRNKNKSVDEENFLCSFAQLMQRCVWHNLFVRRQAASEDFILKGIMI